MSDQMKNLLIGLFTATALAIVVFMVLFLHPYVGDQGQILRVRFTDIDKITVGTRVLLAGKPVGEVKSIKVLDEVSDSRIEKNGDVYVYELELAVDSSLKVYNTDRISLRTSGLLGEKSVSIDPEPPQPDQKLRVVNDEILYAEGTGSVEDTFKEFKQVADKFDLALDLVIDTLQELKDRHTWENVANTIDNLSDISTRLADSWGKVDDTLTNIADTTSNTKEITAKVIEGEGTLGKIVSKDDLYLRTTALLSKGETVLDDMNHYGIMFHLDKGWQRMRSRRMNMLERLKTPQDFRNYFNDEVGQISTSLSRVGMVLDKSEKYPNLMEDMEYRKVFAELMRKVDGLDEALKMYNIQVVDTEAKKTELSDRGY
jgi:phospholipid/cholesterol/gamma-HCH transport system substrate-binding protein